MILKGNLHNNGSYLAAYLNKLAGYLSKENSGDEIAVVAQLRGFASSNLSDALKDIQIEAEMTRCTNPIFHAQMRLRAHERLTEEQWLASADRVEKKLGFSGQPRAIIFHDNPQTGERHAHFVWSRIDRDEQRAIDPGLYKRKLMEVQRSLEREYRLDPTVKLDQGRDLTASPRRGEFEQSRRLGTNIKEIRETIRECWERTDCGKAFCAALSEHGFAIARGDRRDFVVIDDKGGMHALGKRILDVSLADVRARMADLDRSQLPTVTLAQEALERHQQSSRQRQPEKRQEAHYVPLGATHSRVAQTVKTMLDGVIVERGSPWMKGGEGVEGLSAKQRDSARVSYELWAEKNPRLAARHGFEDYVQYVQAKFAEEQRTASARVRRGIPVGVERPAPPRVHTRSARPMATRSGMKLTKGLANVAATILGGVTSFLVSEPKLTAQQAHDQKRADGNLETIHARAYAGHLQARDAEYDYRGHVQKTAQQEKDLRLAQTLGTNHTAEANLGRDEYDRTREQEKERERGGRSL